MNGKSVHLYEVRNLKTSFRTDDGRVQAVDGVSFHVDEGEIVSIVGESGCGKSMTQLSALQLIKMPPGQIESGEVYFQGENILTYAKNSEELRQIRGGKIGMIFQEPMTSLNPSMTIGQQIIEPLCQHLGMTRKEARAEAVALLKRVGIPDAEERIDYYPHQFSGGMCQRAMIAMAISCRPKLLISDEATTALDVTMQEQILELLREIVETEKTSVIMITHNLGIVARFAHRIYVMYAGRIVESGTREDIFKNPRHPYTRGLLKAVPRLDIPKGNRLSSIKGNPLKLIDKPIQCDFAPRCPYADERCLAGVPELQPLEGVHSSACFRCRELESQPAPTVLTTESESVDRSGEPLLSVRDLCVEYKQGGGLFGKKEPVRILDNVSFDLFRGETLGLVGESGCGKTTVARAIMGFVRASAGQILYNGQDLSRLSPRGMKPIRKGIQLVFQDPYGSLDPRQSAGSIIAEPMYVHKLVGTSKEAERRVEELMELVGLSPSQKDRMPHEFSGGQRQRIGIARALAVNPDLIICDEPISALDVSIQAQIINLMDDLQKKLGLSYLFIAHDLAVVRHISDRIAVMYLGRIVETADWREIYENPMHPYTKALLSAAPIPDPDVEDTRRRLSLTGEVPSVARRPAGCSFHQRCKRARPECAREYPGITDYGNGHLCACPYLPK